MVTTVKMSSFNRQQVASDCVGPIVFQISQCSDCNRKCRFECIESVRTTGPSCRTELLQISSVVHTGLGISVLLELLSL